MFHVSIESSSAGRFTDCAVNCPAVHTRFPVGVLLVGSSVLMTAE